MTIVLYNLETNILTICDDQVQNIDLNIISLDAVANYLDNKKILYVTEYVETNFSSVSEVLTNQNMQVEDVDGYSNSIINKKYLHTTNKCKFVTKFDGSQYMFKGLYDCKPLDDLPANLITECKDIVEALRLGILEIIEEKEFLALMIQKNKEPIRKTKQNILNNLSSNFDGDGEKGSIDNPIEIDLSANGNFKRNRT